VTVGNNIYHIHYIHPDASLDNLTLSTTPVDHVVLALTYHSESATQTGRRISGIKILVRYVVFEPINWDSSRSTD